VRVRSIVAFLVAATNSSTAIVDTEASLYTAVICRTKSARINQLFKYDDPLDARVRPMVLICGRFCCPRKETLGVAEIAEV
jgi:hypothetical protein